MTEGFFLLVAIAVISTVFSLPAYSQARPETAVKQRQSAMTLQAGAGEAAIKAQILAVDKTCNSCHDTFRERQ